MREYILTPVNNNLVQTVSVDPQISSQLNKISSHDISYENIPDSISNADPIFVNKVMSIVEKFYNNKIRGIINTSNNNEDKIIEKDDGTQNKIEIESLIKYVPQTQKDLTRRVLSFLKNLDRNISISNIGMIDVDGKPTTIHISDLMRSIGNLNAGITPKIMNFIKNVNLPRGFIRNRQYDNLVDISINNSSTSSDSSIPNYANSTPINTQNQPMSALTTPLHTPVGVLHTPLHTRGLRNLTYTATTRGRGRRGVGRNHLGAIKGWHAVP